MSMLKLATGECAKTVSGRQTTPFPKFQTAMGKTTAGHIQAVDQWLIQNAADEAAARGDRMNARIFSHYAERPNNISQSDKDSAYEYLFGDPEALIDSPRMS